MPTIRITALTELAETPADSDVFALEDISAGTTKKVTSAHVRAGLASNAGLSAEVSAREAHEAAANPHSGSASTTALGLVDTAVSTHVARTDNPHSVTAAQVGAIPATSGAATPYVSAASETAAGISELSTLAEAVTGTDTARVVTVAAARQAQISLTRDTLGKFPGIIPPSLNLFCGNSTSDTAPTGTFTRSTTGTRLGQAGLIETVAAGSVRREWDASGNLLGWLIEESRTNVVLYSRDLTNAAWVKTNCAASLSQTGIDGVASSASLLTASADAATCLQSITLASSSRFQTAYLKRITGSGAVSMTMNGGTTWTDITASLSTTAWTRVSIPAQTLTNPSVGFKLATSGDAIAVDGVQNEAGAFTTSVIFTTSAAVARAADVWTKTLDTSWFNQSSFTLFLRAYVDHNPTDGYLLLVDDGSISNRIQIVFGSTRNIDAFLIVGSSIIARTVFVNTSSGHFRIALSFSNSKLSLCVNGNNVSSASCTSIFGAFTSLKICEWFTGTTQLNGCISHLSYFPTALSNTQLQSITL
jgi:hypothetical protein